MSQYVIVIWILESYRFACFQIGHENKRQKTKNQQQKSSCKNPVLKWIGLKDVFPEIPIFHQKTMALCRCSLKPIQCWKFPAGNAGDDNSKIYTRTIWAWLSELQLRQEIYNQEGTIHMTPRLFL